MLLEYLPSITADDDIDLLYPADGSNLRGQKRSIAFEIVGHGGQTVTPADVTMTVTIFADIGPAEESYGGSVVDVSEWIDVTPAVYRMDTNAKGAASFTFIGNTDTTAILVLDDLNVDKLRILAEFSDVPDAATPAKLVVKVRDAYL